MPLQALRANLTRRLGGHGLVRIGSAMVVVQGTTILAGVGVSVLLARELGTEGYGLYLFALNVAQMLAMPILAGLPTLVTREVAISRAQDDEARLNGIIRWSYRGIAATSAFVAVVIGAAVFFIPNAHGGLNAAYLWVLPFVIGLGLARITSAIIQGFERPFYGSLPDGAIRPVFLLAMIALASAFGTIVPAHALGLHLAAILIGLAWAFWYLRVRIGHYPDRRATVRFEHRAWLTSLVPLSLITAAGLINTRLDILMLGFLSEKSEVALYGLAGQIAGFVLIGQIIFNTIVGPKIARSYAEGDIYGMALLSHASARASAAVAIAGVVSIILFANWAIRVLLGSEFSDSWLIALILASGHLFSAANGPVGLILKMTGQEKTTLRAVTISAAVNFILNLTLIPSYGAIGGAVATVMSTLLRQVFMSVSIWRKFGFVPTVFYWKKIQR